MGTRMVLETMADPARTKGAARRIAKELGVRPKALRFWVEKAQVDGGLRGISVSKQQGQAPPTRPGMS